MTRASVARRRAPDLPKLPPEAGHQAHHSRLPPDGTIWCRDIAGGAPMIVSAKFLQDLAAYRSDEGILSVYLRVDPKLMYDRRHPLSEFKAALKHVNNQLGEPGSEHLDR